MIERRPFVQKILKNRKDNLRVVSGIGTSTWDLMSAGDNVGNFGFIGAMGQSIPFALGLAQAKPKYRILLFTGDGDTLMSLGSIATIANHPVSNLTIIVLDNEGREKLKPARINLREKPNIYIKKAVVNDYLTEKYIHVLWCNDHERIRALDSVYARLYLDVKTIHQHEAQTQASKEYQSNL